MIADFEHAVGSTPEPSIAGRIVLDDSAIVPRPKGFQSRLSNDLLPVVSFGHLRCVHDHGQRPDGLDFGVLDGEVDRHSLFELGVAPAPGSERLGSAEHEDSHPELSGTLHHHFHLCVGYRGDLVHRFAAGARHPGKDHRVVALEFHEARKEIVGGPEVDHDIVFPQCIDEGFVVTEVVRILDKHHARLSSRIGKCCRSVVLSDRIIGQNVGNEFGLVGVAGCLIDFVRHWDDVDISIQNVRGIGQDFCLATDSPHDSHPAGNFRGGIF